MSSAPIQYSCECPTQMTKSNVCTAGARIQTCGRGFDLKVEIGNKIACSSVAVKRNLNISCYLILNHITFHWVGGGGPRHIHTHSTDKRQKGKICNTNQSKIAPYMYHFLNLN